MIARLADSTEILDKKFCVRNRVIPETHPSGCHTAVRKRVARITNNKQSPGWALRRFLQGWNYAFRYHPKDLGKNALASHEPNVMRLPSDESPAHDFGANCPRKGCFWRDDLASPKTREITDSQS